MADEAKKGKTGKPKKKMDQQTMAAFMALNEMSLTRRQAMANLFDPRRDIDDECGYPKIISPEQYRGLYDREGIATRVVSIYPEESWTVDPEIKESEDVKDTEFEKEWKELQEEHLIYHYLHRIDELSGIGQFGVLLIGIDDGLELDKPVEGINEDGTFTVGSTERKMLYLRAYDQSVVTITQRQTDQANPRYGLPVMYQIAFESVDATAGTAATSTKSQNVHWTRLIHVADNRKMSEILGVPRLEPVYNRIYDLRKILSGSGEMFWKGAFPGLSFEVNEDLTDADLDTDSLKEEIAAYANGLQRYIALTGITAKSLAPQVADPSGHVSNQLKAIAISLSVPTRIMFGSEEAKLASTQDAKTWNKRVARRQNKYLSPMLLRPFIDRLMAFGILTEVEDYWIEWPDMNVPTDEDKAKVAEIRTKALASYVGANISQLIPPEEFFRIIFELDPEEIATITAAADKFTLEEGDTEVPRPQDQPPGTGDQGDE